MKNLKFPPALVMVVAALVYVLAVIQRMSPPVVALEIMNDLGLDPDGLSLMFAATLVCYGLMQPVAGFWADRFGPRRCLLAATLILGLSSFGFYAAKGMLLGLPSRALVGFAGGIALIPCLKLAANWFTPKQFGFISSCMVGSAAAANFIVGRPMAMAVESFGWRWCFLALGFAGLALSVLVWMMIHDRPAGYQPPAEEAETPRIGFFESAGAIVRLPEFWLLGCLYACTDLMYGVLTGLWAGPYLMEVYQLSEETVGNMLSVSAVGFLLGPPLWAFLAALWKSYAKMLLCMTVINVAVAAAFVSSPASLGLPALYAMCLLAPLGAQMAGMIFVLATKLVPPRLSASAMGLINIFAILPVAFMQKIIGGILTRGAALEPALPVAELYGRAFTPMLICVIISVPLALWQVRREKKMGAAF